MMKTILFTRKSILSILILSFSIFMSAKESSIIPKPMKMEYAVGEFTLSSKTVIGYEAGLKEYADYLQEVFLHSTGWELTLKETEKEDATIHLAVSRDKVQQTEGYKLNVSATDITICGADKAGVFYGIQTLLQLFPAGIYSATVQRNIRWSAPAISIFDAPERPWRGMMLDVARYFYDKEFVKKYIDMMAMYKLNKLQFHMIDDSGWRLEIKKYPRLTDVGAWAGTEANRIGGYYTQEDIKELIDYAALRNVEIIPEIEFPAHILSAIVAYPWLSCTEQQHEVPSQHFISRDLLCVGKESSFQFLEDVLEETVNLFPSSYINIGGDEAVYTRWEECPECQKLLKRKGLKKTSELHGYLTNRVSEMMKKKNRTVVGWEEIILRGKLENPVVSVFWHNVADTIQATRSGHKGILSPATHLYLDFPESSTPGEIKAATWMPPISLEKCYSMPINDYSPTSTVLGIQGCFWSDQFIHGTILQELSPLNENRSENYAEYLTFPRLLALSEIAWKRKSECNFDDFKARLRYHYPRLDFKNCHYRVPEPEVFAEQSRSSDSTEKWEIRLSSNVEGADIRYTVDGSYPTIYSPRYTQPVTVEKKEKLRAITVVNPRHYSLPTYDGPDYSAFTKYGKYVTEWKAGQIKAASAPWRFECTGKISGNGTYELSFIYLKGKHSLRLGDLQLFKRNEKLESIHQKGMVNKASPVTTYRFDVSTFEAGTPFFIEVRATPDEGNDTDGFIFIKKVHP